MIRHLFRMLGIMAAIHLTYGFLSYFVGCAAMKDAFFGPDPVASPVDEAELFHCRLLAEADLGINHDAGGACHLYDSCVIDAGERGDINFCDGGR